MDVIPHRWTFDWTLRYVRLLAALLIAAASVMQILNDLNGFYN